MVQVEVYTTSNRKLGNISVPENSKVKEIKKEIAKISKLKVECQSVRADARGKDIRDNLSVENIGATRKVYVKDLGPQIGWNIVFLLEYAGPLIIYGMVALRPWLLYGDKDSKTPMSLTAMVALGCWSVHYLKRILETLFVHRFSHGTMPIRNLFKNCSYYWGFALYVAYHVNHPYFMPPSLLLQIIGFAVFTVCEIGNGSIHILLRNLRPAGTTVRKIPIPGKCLFTRLFNFVSCPNYMYEVGAWIGFTIMTSCLPAALFTLAGFYQMAVWASVKHRNYLKEFPDYPKQRRAIIPFVF